MFIHVGKAGGSSLSCKLQIAVSMPIHHCPGKKDEPALNSQVSRRVGGHFHHWLPAKKFLMPFDNYLIVVRHPVTRIQSAYAYTYHYPPRPGEGGDAPCFSDINGMLPLSSVTVCALAGAQCIAGYYYACGRHFFANYEFFMSPVLEILAKNPSRQLFTIRSEHRVDDYRKLDLLWGGVGVNVSDVRIRDMSHRAVRNRNVAASRMELLCRILCREIYYYKWSLLLAQNLDDDEVRESFRELGLLCPGEAAKPPTLRHRGVRAPPLLAQRSIGHTRDEIIGNCVLPEL